MCRPREQLPVTLLNDVLRIVPVPNERDRIRQRRLNRAGDPGAQQVLVVWPFVGSQWRLPSKG